VQKGSLFRRAKDVTRQGLAFSLPEMRQVQQDVDTGKPC